MEALNALEQTHPTHPRFPVTQKRSIKWKSPGDHAAHPRDQDTTNKHCINMKNLRGYPPHQNQKALTWGTLFWHINLCQKTQTSIPAPWHTLLYKRIYASMSSLYSHRQATCEPLRPRTGFAALLLAWSLPRCGWLLQILWGASFLPDTPSESVHR